MSWSADSQLVRGEIPGGYNLAIGDPVFLREVFEPYYPTSIRSGLYEYPAAEPIPELKWLLERRYPGRHVTVTLGAKQALYAAVAAIKAQNPGGWPRDPSLCHRVPMWPSYVSLAENSGRDFRVLDRGFDSEIFCNTSPNNPDGSESDDGCDIWDAAYASEAYGWSGKMPHHRISVWSAGKLLGLPGIRLGWAVTSELGLSVDMCRYVEQHTSGVPQVSQFIAAATLANTYGIRDDLYARAGQTLRANAEEFLKLAPFLDTVQGYPMNGRGMFAFFKVKNHEHFEAARVRAKVALVTGEACGMKESGWYRLSLGQTSVYTRSAIAVLLNELERP